MSEKMENLNLDDQNSNVMNKMDIKKQKNGQDKKNTQNQRQVENTNFENPIGKIILTDKRTPEEKENNPIDVEALKEDANFTPEQRKARGEMISNLRDGNLNGALDIKEEFILPEEIMSDFEIQEAAKEGMSYLLSKGQFNYATELEEKFSLNDQQIAEVARNAFAECLLNYYDSGNYEYYINYALQIQKNFSVSQEIVREIAAEAICSCFSSYYSPQEDRENVENADILCQRFQVSQEQLENPKIQSLLENVMVKQLEYGCVDEMFWTGKIFLAKPEIYSSDRIKKAAKEALRVCLCNGGFKDVERVRKEISLSDEDIQDAIQSAMGECFLDRDFEENAKEINEKYPISPRALQKMFKKVLSSLLIDRDTNRVLNIIDNYPVLAETISDSELQKLASELAANDILAYRSDEDDENHFGFIESAMDIMERFRLSSEYFLAPNIQNVAKETLFMCLYKGEIDNAHRVIDMFKVNVSPRELIDRDRIVKKLFDELKEIVPVFCDQALKSTDIVFSLYSLAQNPETSLETIKNSSFLLDAVLENPRFGSKLLVKYPEFDETSKENISFLFSAKKEIMEENPDIDPESNDFRIAMQEKLKTYKNNEEILLQIECLGIRKDLIKELAEQAKEEILKENSEIDLESMDYRIALREKIKSYKKNRDIFRDEEFSGIDTEQWLNYSETEYFSLDSGNSNLAFSETVATPINRIKETISSYSYRVKEVIKEYRKELKEFKIQASDVSEIPESTNKTVIDEMKKKLAEAKEEGNAAKVKGLKKKLLVFLRKRKKGKRRLCGIKLSAILMLLTD